MTAQARVPEPLAEPTRAAEQPARSGGSRSLLRRAVTRFLLLPPVLGALLFLPAGTLAYWQAWLYLGVIMSAVAAVGTFLFRRDPDFLARRLRMHEDRARQRWVQVVGIPVYLAIFVVPALDRRFGWSSPPTWLVLAAAAVMLAGYGFVIWVFHANRFAGRTIQVEAQQRLITSGPYRVVRHPMYLGVLVMMGVTPLALGSTWGLLTTLVLPVTLVVRIVDEERMLRPALPGYDAYARRTRYRLIPGLW